MIRNTVACILLAVTPVFAAGQEPFFLKDKQRVVFVGDSNTFAGQFIAYLDAALFTRFPDQSFELINVGLPSETVSGLSEPDHPFPRPDVHTRLAKVLAKTKPDVVVACYGMNDGIYYPLSQERFEKHKQGMLKLIDDVEKAGAKIVLVTTSPFDPLPLKGKVLSDKAVKYSWMTPYEKYDDVLAAYSDWLLTLRKKGLMVIDIHGVVNQHLRAMRKSDPQYRLAGDGIHPNATGHWLWAAEIMKAWHLPAAVDEMRFKVDRKDGVIHLQGQSRLPLAVDPRWPGEFPEKAAIRQAVNQYRLVVKDCPAEEYELWEGKVKLGTVSRKQLQDGVDLTRFAEMSSNKQSLTLLKLAEKRQQILGRAWLSDIGHDRPNTPVGLPLEKALPQARELEQEIRQLARPVLLSLELRAMGK
jgi:lysophospholipase L1-like esterase